MSWFFRYFVCLMLVASFGHAEELRVSVLGLGSRIQGLLLNCLQLEKETGKTLKVVAVCDNYGQESFESFVKRFQGYAFAEKYRRIFENAKFYSDSEEGLAKLFQEHPKIDRILIASANDRHLTHLQAAVDKSGCKQIFMEKPLFRNLDEFESFKSTRDDLTIHVGLTLRYAAMTRIVTSKLREYRHALGKLQKVSSWEHVNFAHAMTIIMMNWRRLNSLSGGLLLEKCVHDLDLALVFMKAVSFVPEKLSIETQSDHRLFKKSNQDKLLNQLFVSPEHRSALKRWEERTWQRMIHFAYTDSGQISWKKTLENFFKDFPADDDFTNSDIIPDYQRLTAKMNDSVDYELEVKLTDELSTKRGVKMVFEKGVVDIDIMRDLLQIKTRSGHSFACDLQTGGSCHADGDLYVALTILGVLPENYPRARFNDPEVQLSTLMGAVSEYQAQGKKPRVVTLTKVGEQWRID